MLFYLFLRYLLLYLWDRNWCHLLPVVGITGNHASNFSHMTKLKPQPMLYLVTWLILSEKKMDNLPFLIDAEEAIDYFRSKGEILREHEGKFLSEWVGISWAEDLLHFRWKSFRKRPLILLKSRRISRQIQEEQNSQSFPRNGRIFWTR